MERYMLKTFEELGIELSEDAPDVLNIKGSSWKIGGIYQTLREIIYVIDKDKRIAELEAFVTIISTLDLGHDTIADANILIDLQQEAKSLLGIDNSNSNDISPF